MSTENRSHKKKPAKPELKKLDFKIDKVEDAKYVFSDHEMVDFAKDADAQNAEVVTLNGRFDSLKTQFKSDVKTAENRRDEALRKVRVGHDFRRANCVIDYNVPEKGKKTFWHHLPDQKNIRGEQIYVKDMSEADLQTEMQLNAESTKPVPPVAPLKAGEPLVSVDAAFKAGTRKRKNQRVINAEVVDTHLLAAPPSTGFSDDSRFSDDQSPAGDGEKPHITQPGDQTGE